MTITRDQLITLIAGATVEGKYDDGGSEHDDQISTFGFNAVKTVLSELGIAMSDIHAEIDAAVASLERMAS